MIQSISWRSWRVFLPLRVPLAAILELFNVPVLVKMVMIEYLDTRLSLSREMKYLLS